MPFVDKRELKNFIPEGIFNHFISNPTEFTSVEAQAGLIITRFAGVASPADIADRPDWAIVHIANIITYLTSHILEPLSQDLVSSINKKYNDSIEFLKSVATRGPSTDIEYGACGPLLQVNTW